jgi:hypothetical protein
MTAVNKSSSILGGEMQQQDEKLKQLRDAIDPICTEIENDAESDTAVIMIGGRTIQDAGTIETIVDIVGDYTIIQEALFTEIMAQIEAGNADLFQAFREVVHAVEEELNLEPNEELEGPRIYH